MTVRFIEQENAYFALSTDTFPTGRIDGRKLIETDTGVLRYYDEANSTWFRAATPGSTTGNQKQLFFRFADTVGDGSGSYEANGDYSVTATDFKIAPAAGEVLRLSRAILMIEDVGVMDSGFYGNNVVLTNGLKPYVERNGTREYIINSAQPKILTNGDVAAFCHDLERRGFGLGNEFITARWTFTKAGQFFRLDGDNNDEWGVNLNDDFTGLVKHRFMIQGYYEKTA